MGIAALILYFSGKVATRKEIIEVITKFNIQVDNLTQVSS